MKHTKGPWRHYNGIIWVDGLSIKIGTVNTIFIPVSEHEANCRLIAAAPDLLEALQELVQLKEWKDKHGKDEHYEKSQPIAWRNALEAIKKATS